MYFRNSIIILLLSLFSIFCIAQQSNYSIDRYSIGIQPKGNKINNICQDKVGFIWIATQNGLFRFDGYRFTAYYLPPITHDSAINCLFVTSKNDIWVGTRSNGLLSFNPTKEQFTPIINAENQTVKIVGKSIIDIIGTSKGTKWVLTDKGVNRIYATNNVHYYKFPKSFKNNDKVQQNKSMAFDSNGVLWIINGGALFQLDTKTESFHTAFESSFKSNLISIEKIGYQQICVGTEKDGIYIINSNTNKIVNCERPKFFSNSYAANFIVSLKKDNKGNLWIGSNYGLHKLNLQQIDNMHSDNLEIPDANILIDKSINCIVEDRSGALWIATHECELLKITPPFKFFMQYLPNVEDKYSLSDTKINAFIQDKSGMIWIGTRKGLNCFNPKTRKFIPLTLSSKDWENLNEVSSFFNLKDNNLLIGTWNRESAFSFLNLKTKQFKYFTYGETTANAVASIFDIDNELYISTFGRGLLTLNQNDLAKPILPKKTCVAEQNLHDIHKSFLDSRKRIWVSFHSKALAQFDTKSGKCQYFKHDSLLTSISNNMINSICEDGKHQIWIGTDNGINLFDTTKNIFKRYYPDNMLGNNKILGITNDKYNNIWFSQETRIGKFNPTTKDFIFYDILSWLPNCIFQSSSVYKDNDGVIYFGTSNNGFITFIPDSCFNFNKPSVIISNLLVDNKIVSPNIETNGRIILRKDINNTDEIELSYKENIFTIEFAALSYAHASENRFAYKLEGFQKEWVFTNSENHYAVYSNLLPGKYTFRVKASNYMGMWNESSKQITIVVKTPPWKTWWAFCIYLLLLAFVVTSIIYYNIKRIRILESLRFERFEKEQIKILNQQKLQFFTNISHEFRTPLTLISVYNKKIIEHSDENEKIYPWITNTQKNIEHLLLMVNQLLDFRKLEESQTKLSVTKNDLVAFCNTIFQSYTHLAKIKNISYKMTCNLSEAFVWFDNQKLERILFNLLSNAFKFTNEGETIELSITVENIDSRYCKIIIEIYDTGIGISANETNKIFDSFYQTMSALNAQNPGTGIGLAFAKQLTELHHGTLSVESEKGKGSIFIVKLPASKEKYNDNEIESQSINEKIIENPPAIVINTDEMKSLDDAPIILVVEDNIELRNLIARDLLQGYHIIEADNGIEGFEKAIAHNPDLIISDVLMPHMDGIEMCRRLKNDLQSSHIPILFLSARVLDENKLEGFKSGADDYIEKPFSSELLILKIKNILETQRRLKQQYLKITLGKPEIIFKSPLDDKFFEQATQIIEKHFSNYEFDVIEFCDEMRLGQKLIYRKIKSVTGLSITEFIRSERLKRAAQLVRENKYTIQEISYKVGFSTPSYFSKCFKKQFGIMPKDF